MWEAISGVLQSPNAGKVLFFFTVIIILTIAMIISGRVTIKTKHLNIGKVEQERETIRRQVEAARDFIMSIEGKIPKKPEYGGYFTKYILERVYDKVIEWIMFNHISDTPMYVQDKQSTICNLVYTFNIGEEYKTPEFKNRMCNWTQELITRLVRIREIYSKQEELKK